MRLVRGEAPAGDEAPSQGQSSSSDQRAVTAQAHSTSQRTAPMRPLQFDADLGVAKNTVRNARQELVNTDQLADGPHTGLDGKTRRVPIRDAKGRASGPLLGAALDMLASSEATQ
jgi:hypothetical protein